MAENLWQLERRLWSGGADIYRQNLHRYCLMVFAPPAGVMTREMIIRSVESAPRWKDVAITNENVVMPRGDVAVLGYDVWARREGGDPYSAVCSSTWLEEGGLWMLIQHQQAAV